MNVYTLLQHCYVLLKLLSEDPEAFQNNLVP